jgi:hypothetical protein
MTTIINGSSPSITFSDSTTQTTALPAPSTAGNLLTSNGTAWASTAPAGGGKVLQVVSSVFSTNVTTTNSTFTATGMSASITPSNSSNKVYMIVSIAGNQTTANGGGLYTIYRGATNIGNASEGFNEIYINTNVGGSLRVPVIMSFLDSPATTSATTYQVYFKTNTVGTVGINPTATNSTITLMEIAA